MTTDLLALQLELRALKQRVERMERQSAGLNLDLNGRRVINAGRAIGPADYVTKAQVEDLRQALLGDDLRVRTLEVKQRARFLGDVYMPGLEDAGIVFVKADGSLATDEAGFSFRYTNGSLRIADDAAFRWHHLIWLRASGTPGAFSVFEIRGEDDNTTTPLARVALGLDSAGHPALVPSGANLELREAGGGALTDLTVDTLHATTIDAPVPSGGDVSFDRVTADEFIATSPATYTATNVTTDRSFDADATTLDEIADVVGTLIADLRTLKLVA
jgi:hypothetical protein